jgi:3-hydroxybutyryl-CoA dehydrogenase
MIIAEKQHPLYDLLKSHFVIKSKDEAIASYETYEFVIDLTILKTDRKILFLKELLKTTRAIIISDLTCTFQEKVFHQIPQVKASISSVFYSPNHTFEYFLKPNQDPSLNENIHKIIDTFCTIINYKSRESKILEITFTLPRVVAQIINESYFALEENLATKSSIDQAMCYGVNYPMGPFAWAQKTGIHHVLAILEELYVITTDVRYRPSFLLKKECL